MIKWTTTKEEMQTISKIADRAIAMSKDIGISLKKMDTLMDEV